MPKIDADFRLQRLSYVDFANDTETLLLQRIGRSLHRFVEA